MNYNTKVAVITFSVFFGLLILGVTLIVVLTRPKAVATVTPTPAPIPVTPTPPPVTNILLKDSNGLCFQFANLQPVLGAPEKCTGFWIDSPLTQTVTFDGTTYETCIQPAVISGTSVLGTIGAGCNTQIVDPTTGKLTVTDGVVLENTVIRSTKENVCINNTANVLTWGSCGTAFNFVVESL